MPTGHTIPDRRPRIFLIHATPLAIEPIAGSFARLWPEAELCNLLDDSLSADLARAGNLDSAMMARFLALARYAESAAATGILFTCSAFGPAIEACRASLSMPILKPNEAMIDQAISMGGKIGLLATFAPALESMAEEFRERAAALEAKLDLQMCHVPDAFQALQRGDAASHDAAIARHARELRGCDLICFAQFSMARAAAVASTESGRPVLTTPDSAVGRLKNLVGSR